MRNYKNRILQSLKRRTDNSENQFETSEKRRKKAVYRGYLALRKIAEKQLKLLRLQEKDPAFLKFPRHHFIFEISKSFWRDADFALSLRNKKWGFYAVYPVRTMMEKNLKMLFFFSKTTLEQDEIADKEFLLSAKRIYDFQKARNMGDTEMIKMYRGLNNENKYPDILIVKDGELKAFTATYETLCEQFKSKKEYHYYRWLSGVPHGQLGYTMFIKATGDTDHRRLIMKGNFFCYDFLKTIDKYLNSGMGPEIEESFKKVKKLLKMGFGVNKDK